MAYYQIRRATQLKGRARAGTRLVLAFAYYPGKQSLKDIMTERGKLISTGKSKSLYEHPTNSDWLIMKFRDDTSRFDGEKIESLEGKGKVSNFVNAFIMEHLQNIGVDTHFVARISDTESTVRRLRMIPVESVARNRAAGGFCRRYGDEHQGEILDPPVQELFVKDDARHDPMVSETGAVALGPAVVVMARLTRNEESADSASDKDVEDLGSTNVSGCMQVITA